MTFFQKLEPLFTLTKRKFRCCYYVIRKTRRARFEPVARSRRLHYTFFSDQRPSLETLDHVFGISAVHQPFYISICIWTTGYLAHYTFIKLVGSAIFNSFTLYLPYILTTLFIYALGKQKQILNVNSFIPFSHGWYIESKLLVWIKVGSCLISRILGIKIHILIASKMQTALWTTMLVFFRVHYMAAPTSPPPTPTPWVIYTIFVCQTSDCG